MGFLDFFKGHLLLVQIIPQRITGTSNMNNKLRTGIGNATSKQHSKHS